MGLGASLVKVDVWSVYRMLPIYPDHRCLLGMRCKGNLFVKLPYVPFGLGSAPNLFTPVADALEWIAEPEGMQPRMHYLDDFLTVGPPGSPICVKKPPPISDNL